METARTRDGQGPALQTAWRRRKDARDRAMAEEYDRLMAESPGRSRTEVKNYLKRKHGLSADSAYYAALERGWRKRKGVTE